MAATETTIAEITDRNGGEVGRFGLALTISSQRAGQPETRADLEVLAADQSMHRRNKALDRSLRLAVDARTFFDRGI